APAALPTHTRPRSQCLGIEGLRITHVNEGDLMATTQLRYHVTLFDAAGDSDGYEPFWSYQILSTHTGWSIHDESSLKLGFRQIESEKRLGMKVLNYYRIAVDDLMYAHKQHVPVDMAILLVRTGFKRLFDFTLVTRVTAELRLDDVQVVKVYPI